MKVPLSWLKEWIDISLPPEELAGVLTRAGLEVEGIEQQKSDVVLDVTLTPNLGHCMSILGVARELAALLDLPLKSHVIEVTEGPTPIDSQVQISLIDRAQALRFCCRVVMGVRVGPSPEWMRHKLEMCGIRSINNVVDVGNLVMLERGQPLHLFDYDDIAGKHLFVTSQTPYEELGTLDDVTRLIPPEALLVCDEKKPLSFAGVMGGKQSSVTEKTQNILIEAAYFTPQAIRKTGRLLGVRSDSALRFEKGIDPNGVLPALDRAAMLLQQVAGGVVSQGVVDACVREFKQKKIHCRIPRVNEILGTTLSLGEVAEILRRLQITIEAEEGNLLTVSPPTYRNDLNHEIDLIEEIARVYGYPNIPKVRPKHFSSTLCHAPMYLLEKNVRQRLLQEGLQELLTCDLISPIQAEVALENSLSKEVLISVLHPSSIDQSVLRTSVLPGLLQVVKHNQDHSQEDLWGFEVGRVHFKEKESFREYTVAGVILSGEAAPYHFDPKPREIDFFDLKGLVENIFEGLKIPPFKLVPSHLHHFHPGRQGRIKVGDLLLGVVGEVHPAHLAASGIQGRVLFAEWNLDDLLPLTLKQWTVSTPNPYPGSARDWTVTVAQQMPIETLLSLMQSCGSPLLEQVYLLDLYKSEQIGKDRKNVTFRFLYRDPNKTIAFETVDAEHSRLIHAVEKQLKSL